MRPPDALISDRGSLPTCYHRPASARAAGRWGSRAERRTATGPMVVGRVVEEFVYKVGTGGQVGTYRGLGGSWESNMKRVILGILP